MIFPSEWYEELLRHASFGPLRLGMSEASVIEIFGAPDYEGFPGKKKRIVAFDTKHLQATFHNGRVVHFGLYFHHCDEPKQLSGIQLSETKPVEDLGNWTRERGIGWSESSMSTDCLHLRLDNGVVAVFEDRRLSSLQVA